MNTNAIRELLQEVARTAELPSEEQLTAVMIKGSATEREAARRGIRVVAKRIVARLNAGEPETIREDLDDLISAAVVKHSVVTGRAEDDPDDPRVLAGRIAAARDTSTVGRDDRLAAARGKIEHASELVELLRHAGGQGGVVDDRDLDQLRLRPDVDREQWRAQVHKAAHRVGQLYAEGRLGDSREEARAAGEDLAKLLAKAPAHRDPMRDVEDPRELARAIRGDRSA